MPTHVLPLKTHASVILVASNGNQDTFEFAKYIIQIYQNCIPFSPARLRLTYTLLRAKKRESRAIYGFNVSLGKAR